MMFWDARQAQPVHVMPCPGKVQCIDSKVHWQSAPLLLQLRCFPRYLSCAEFRSY